VEDLLSSTTAGCVGTGIVGGGVAIGGAAAMKEMAVDCDTLCAGSAQPPASRQWALHIRWPQSLRIRVELHPITGHEDFCTATEGAGKRL
jgi:hypothetical protein